jgi:formate dehydrogenase subunit delta
MSSNDIIRMANDISHFFAAYPHDEAVAGVQGHIKDYWEPRMKKALKACIAAGGKGLEPLVLEAAAGLPG